MCRGGLQQTYQSNTPKRLLPLAPCVVGPNTNKQHLNHIGCCWCYYYCVCYTSKYQRSNYLIVICFPSRIWSSVFFISYFLLLFLPACLSTKTTKIYKTKLKKNRKLNWKWVQLCKCKDSKCEQAYKTECFLIRFVLFFNHNKEWISRSIYSLVAAPTS